MGGVDLNKRKSLQAFKSAVQSRKMLFLNDTI